MHHWERPSSKGSQKKSAKGATKEDEEGSDDGSLDVTHPSVRAPPHLNSVLAPDLLSKAARCVRKSYTTLGLDEAMEEWEKAAFSKNPDAECVQKCKAHLKWKRECAVNQFLLDKHQDALFSLRRVNDREWEAKIWITPIKVRAITLLASYVRHHILTAIAFKDSRFRATKCVRVGHCDRKENIRKECFKKLMCNPTTKTYVAIATHGKEVPMSIEWLKETVGEVVMKAARCLPGNTVAFPNQAAKRRSFLPPKHEGGPRIAFPNHGKEGRCLPNCFASAVFYLGYPKPAMTIANASLPIIDQRNSFRSLVLKELDLPQNHWVGIKCNINDPTSRRANPVVAQLKASVPRKGHGKKTQETSMCHTVCIVDDLVFDSNLDTAVACCTESMNYICDLVVEGAFFTGFEWCREVMLFDKPRTMPKRKRPPHCHKKAPKRTKKP